MSISSPLPPPPDPIFTLRPRSGIVQSVQYARCNDKHSILTGMSSGCMSLWDIELKRQYWTKKVDGNVTSTKFITNKGVDNIISLQREGKLTLWNVELCSIVSESAIPSPGFCGLSVLESDVPRVIFADRDYGKINVFNFDTKTVDTVFKTKELETRGMCMCATVFENGGIKHVLGGFEDGKVSCWDLRNPEQEISTVELFSEPIMCIDYNANTRHGICGSPDNTLETFTYSETGNLSKKYSVQVKNKGIASVRIRLDGKIMASGGWDGRIRLFGCKKGKPLAALNFHTDTVQCIDFVPDGAENYTNLLMCGSQDERISLWKIY